MLTELVSKLNVDRLILRQRQGFLCVGQQAEIYLEANLKGYFLHLPLPIYIPLTIQERPIPMAFI